MERAICIHGHFYQPPRENPWLEAIELQDSAAPYHDWNERITRECYAPNAVSRILDNDGLIVKLINNYARMSFNFGPTLLSWLELKAPEVYAAILQADRQSCERFSGHGSAIAQVYNHMILPLGNSRDRATQILWGIRDFEYRFRRPPEGMWLPETAVDIESLELLAQFGIRFAILAPHQAARVRRIGEADWQDLNGAHIDPRQPYLQTLPSGRSIALFFYDGPVSRAVAFEGLLSNGERLIERLSGVFEPDIDRPQLAHIATDGESYGHHHRFGDMALAYALEQIEARGLARLTNYGEHLERYPPADEVQIVEKTSWSCPHGIDRWWRNCGCSSAARAEWNQEWRTPLRDSLDWLRDQIAPIWERHAAMLLQQPWSARDDYIDVVLDRSGDCLHRFFSRHARESLTPAQTSRALNLLELQRNAMLMYTSCGWFFDDLAGIETVQILKFAGRVVQLAEELFGEPIETTFVGRVARAESNVPEQGDGARVYSRWVGAARLDMAKLAANYALSNLLTDFPEAGTFYCYDVDLEDQGVFNAGRAKLGTGRLKMRSLVTLDSKEFAFAALHLGDHNMSASVTAETSRASYQQMVAAIAEPFLRADLTGTLREIERRFAGTHYSVQSLFRDEQTNVLKQILAANLDEADTLYRQIYEPRAPLLRYLTHLGIPLPRGFSAAAELVVNSQLRIALEQPVAEKKRILELLESARLEGVALDGSTLEYAYTQALETIAQNFAAEPSLENLEYFHQAAEMLHHLPFPTELWKVQNYFYMRLQHDYARQLARREAGDEQASRWIASIHILAALLRVRLSFAP